jgi:hypothetical protein
MCFNDKTGYKSLRAHNGRSVVADLKQLRPIQTLQSRRERNLAHPFHVQRRWSDGETLNNARSQ